MRWILNIVQTWMYLLLNQCFLTFFKSGHTQGVFFIQHTRVNRGGYWWLESTSAWGCLELEMCGSVSSQHLRFAAFNHFGRSNSLTSKYFPEESLVSFSNQKNRRCLMGQYKLTPYVFPCPPSECFRRPLQVCEYGHKRCTVHLLTFLSRNPVHWGALGVLELCRKVPYHHL